MSENIVLDGKKLDQMKEGLLEGIAGTRPMEEAFADVVKTGEEVFGPYQDAIAAGTARIPGFCVFDGRGYDLDLALQSAPPGWAQILRDIYAVMPSNVIVNQVKEKFGGLRFYYGWSDAPYDETVGKAFEAVVDHGESLSYRTCEVCGAPGITRPHGWVTTLCDLHDAEMHAQRDWIGNPGGIECRYKEKDDR